MALLQQVWSARGREAGWTRALQSSMNSRATCSPAIFYSSFCSVAHLPIFLFSAPLVLSVCMCLSVVRQSEIFDTVLKKDDENQAEKPDIHLSQTCADRHSHR